MNKKDSQKKTFFKIIYLTNYFYLINYFYLTNYYIFFNNNKKLRIFNNNYQKKIFLPVVKKINF